MHKFIYIYFVSSLLIGCAITEEAYYIDREYGFAQNDAFNQQIAYKDFRYAKQVPKGMAGIHAESIMDTYQSSFNKSTEEAPNNNFTKGVFTDNTETSLQTNFK